MKSIRRYLVLALMLVFSFVALVGCQFNVGERKIVIDMNSTLYIGESIDLNATLKQGSLENVSWSIDNEEVAEIRNGQLVALKEGTFNLTAEYAGAKDIKHFRVINYTYYTISYELNEGEEDAENPLIVSYNNGQEVVTLNAPVRTGYVFEGFFKTADFSGLAVSKVDGRNGEDLVLYAKWSLQKFNIEVELNGGTPQEELPEYYTIEDTIVLPAVDKEGFDFVGWLLDGVEATQIDGSLLKDVVIEAQFTLSRHSISYDANGGTLPEDAVTEYVETVGVVLPVPEKEGYKFLGWKLGEELITEISTDMKEDVALVAEWQELVAYIGEDGYGTFAEALAAAQANDTIQLIDGTYAGDFSLAIEGLTIKALTIAESVESNGVVFTGIITIGAKGVTLSHLAFTEGARVKVGIQDDFTFEYNYVHDTTFSGSWSASRLTTGGIINVDASNDDQAVNLNISYNVFENILDTAVSISRYDDLVLSHNVFKDWKYDAVRIDGGYNDGNAIITNNEFVMSEEGGYNGIYFRSLGGHAGSAIPVVYVAGNKFENIGFDGTDALFSGAITQSGYQEAGLTLIIRDNDFTNCKSYLFLRNNATASNHAAYLYTAIVKNNNFYGVPEVRYFDCRKSSDTEATNPALAQFRNNFFADAEGNKVEVDMTKLLNYKEFKAAEEAIQHGEVADEILVTIYVSKVFDYYHQEFGNNDIFDPIPSEDGEGNKLVGYFVNGDEVITLYVLKIVEFKEIDVRYNETFALEEIVEDGYAFVGYFYDIHHSGESIKEIKLVDDIQLYAYFIVDIRKEISYELNGGQLLEGAPTEFVVGLGATLVDAEKENAVFAGWYDNPEFEGEPLSAIPADRQEAITLYAKFDEIQSYEITYDLADGEFITSANFDNATLLKEVSITDYITYQVNTGSEVSLISFDKTTSKPLYWGYITLKTTDINGLFEIVEIVNNRNAITKDYDYAIIWHDGLTDATTKATLSSILSNASSYIGQFVQIDNIPEESTSTCELTAKLYDKETVEISKPFYSYKSGEVIALPTPVKEDCDFLGWDLNGVIITEISATQVGDLNLVASWKEYPVKIDSKLYETIDAALAEAQDGDIINIKAGTYDMNSDRTISKSVTFKGVSKEETILNVHSNNLGAANIKYESVTIHGKGPWNGGVPFYTTSSLKSLTCEDCIIENTNKGIIAQYGTNFSINILNCEIKTQGQFFIWSYNTATIDEINFIGNTVYLSTCGEVTNSAGAFFRIRSLNTKLNCYDNLFIGDVQAIGGIFDNASASASFDVRFNTFKGTTLFIREDGANGAHPIVFDKNLYLDADGNVLTAVPETVEGTATTPDKVICASDEERIEYYRQFKEGVTYTISYDLDGGRWESASGTTSFKELSEISVPNPVKDGYKFMGWLQDGVIVTEFELQNYELKAYFIEDGIYVGEGDLANYATLTEALANAQEGSKIIVLPGTFNEDITISLANVIIKGYEFSEDVKENNAILTGIVTVSAAGVKLSHLVFTEGARVKVGIQDDFTFEYNYVHDTTFSGSWSASRLTTGGIINVDATNDDEAANLNISYNVFENILDTAVSIARYNGLVLSHNVFKDWKYDAVRIDGGYNDGNAIITNNEFVMSEEGGYNGIFFRSLGGHSGSAIPVVYVAGNKFENIGFDGTDALFSGAITQNGYQEAGLTLIIRDNDFTNCKSYLFLRNNATASNHAAYLYTAIVKNNNFYGVPEVRYFDCRKSSDTEATNPALAQFRNNFFADAEGNKVEVDMTKLLNYKEFAAADEAIQHGEVADKIMIAVTKDVDGVKEEVEVEFGKTLSLGEAEKAESFFVGWTLNADFSGDLVEEVSPVRDITVYAKFTAYVYKTISYVLNGGTLGEGSPDQYVLTIGVQLVEPTKEGNNFLGWYDNPEFEGMPLTEISAEATEDYQLYALWQDLSAKYSITYNMNGGNFQYQSYAEVAADFLADMNAINNTTEITADNFTSKCRNAQFTAFLADDAMWAKWSWLFAYMDEKNEYDTSEAIYSEVLTSRTCKGDAWWFLTRDFAGFVNKNANTFYYSLKPVDFTQYAIAEGIFDQLEEVINATDVQVLATPYRPYYTFLGWYENADFSGDPVKVLYKDVTLYAKWEKSTVDLTYVLNNDQASVTAEVVKVHASDSFDLENPTFNAKYWHFDGWFYDESLTQQATSISEYTVAPVTVYAKWTEITGYTINYVLNGGSLKYNGREAVLADFIADYNAAMDKEYALDGSNIPTGAWSDINYHSFYEKTLEDGTVIRDKWLWLAKFLYEISAEKLASNNCNVLGLRKLVNNTSFSGDDIYGISYAFRAFLAGSIVRPNTSYTSVDFTDYQNAHGFWSYLSEVESGVVLNNKGDVVLPQAYMENYQFVGWFDNESCEGDPITVQPESDVTVTLYAKFVEATPVTGVNITNAVSEIKRFETLQLAVEIVPSDAQIKSVKYSSSDSSIASIDNNGLITTYKEGTVTITVTSLSSSGVSSSFELEVYAPGHFEVSYDTVSYLKADETIKLNAQYVNRDGSLASLVWSSADEALATVDDSGIVTGVAEGTVAIKVALADDENTYFEFEVNVIPSTLSEQLEYVLRLHQSNSYSKYDLGIGAGTPAYYTDILGSLSLVAYNMPFEIKDTYVATQQGIDSNHGGTKSSTEFVCVHYTGNMDKGATAAANANYFSTGGGGTSIHYVVGNDGIFASLDESLVGFHAGDGTGTPFEWIPTGVMVQESDPETPVWDASSDSYFVLNGQKTSIKIPTGSTTTTEHVTDKRFFNEMGFAWKVVDGQYYMGTTWWCYTQVAEGRVCNHGGNLNSIGIESAVNLGSDLFLTWHKLSQLVADILIRYDLPMTRVVGHHFFSAKDCPQPLLEDDLELWALFMDMVQANYDLFTTFKDYSFSMEIVSDSASIADTNGRVVLPEFSSCVTYDVTITNNNNPEDVQTIRLSTVVNGEYCK